VISPTERIQDFNARHVFALFPEGGIALELASGTYSSLNATAAAVCRFIEESRSWEDTVSAVKARWQLSSEQARAALSGVLESLASSRPAAAPTEDFTYQPLEDGYALVRQGQPLVAVGRDGDHLRLLTTPDRFPFGLEHCLRVVSPKILAARGCMVLHAATCRSGRHLRAFCGLSGAGKSTVSELLGSLGAPKLADELLLVSTAGGSAYGHPEAEKHIYQWCAASAQTLQAQPAAPLSCAGLSAAIDRPAVPLERLVFLDARARGAASFETDLLPAPEALKEIVVAMFLGRNEPAGLRRFFEGCRGLTSVVRSERARVPGGLAALREALVVYSSKMAS
jgi:hypothetical protein